MPIPLYARRGASKNKATALTGFALIVNYKKSNEKNISRECCVMVHLKSGYTPSQAFTVQKHYDKQKDIYGYKNRSI